ncbi:hypothetical protein [Cryobacterium sp. PAMC25264]|uniref:hypothetical protein n=1 Tax=Cryobacterium sp. PAMC25264 TaxID=2861288 RepID=UPI001C632F93|nr:hypothetical protein [Cryobacterium sp. PAMC25264]QYF74504.1 hypothetical protein KY500_04725 [Cryobacterium sp. PAMC25264]
MNPDPTDDPRDRPTDNPEFDPRRSAEIRALLIRTVAGTPRARRARLSRPAFALAASAALLFAGGVGAGTVVAIDRFADPLVAQDASGAPESAKPAIGESYEVQSLQGVSAQSQDVAATSGSAGDSDLPPRTAADLVPILTLNGQIAYAYPSDIDLARTNVPLGATGGFLDTVPAGQIPIYLADGVTLFGYIDSSRLLK